MKNLIIVAVMAVAFAMGMNAETKTAVFSVNPKMSCQNCENKIKSNLRFEKGVKNIETSLENQTVTVTYDDKKTSPEKIEAGFKKIGYEAKTNGTFGESSLPDHSCCKEGEKACCKEGEKACCKEGKKACCKEGEKACCKEGEKACCKEGKKACCKEGEKSCCKEGEKACCKEGKCKGECKKGECKK